MRNALIVRLWEKVADVYRYLSVAAKAHARRPPIQFDLPFELPMRLLGDALDGAIIIDGNSLIRYVNHAMEELSGFSIGELHGQSMDILVPPDAGSLHSEKVADFITTGRKSTVLGHVRELEIRHRSGERLPIEMKAVDLGCFHGNRYFGAFVTDLRQRKKIEARNAELMALLEQQALTDPLTSLPNRRAFEKEAAGAILRAARSEAPVTVGIADVDHFKAINDNYGHAIGDAVLCAVSEAIRSVARDTDIVARLGGEEFGLIFPNTSIEQSGQVAERIRSAVASIQFPVNGTETVDVTISIGLSKLIEQAGLDAALGAADTALYSAKGNGRNRVEASRP
ncbi:GGDEF domain-containing protein [Duganella violaceipulchra]|uniref:diguanylate cyclase n=1 Tax=Duganella violaceipulchra TaxID=2849652 RepID=A0AA41L6W9_9BURK|nr:sensor domain-containing diguanylate cyclase [Duganella violaceicalia]MBV6325719.1 sensor domain-containing diguanylate cyclase [Duganella violaceicalia]MCP2012843.1 diguanylate cyclase (GGDEF)-like protein/PAS domain S-box-containing protein [Duganella violaceicalia]